MSWYEKPSTKNKTFILRGAQREINCTKIVQDALTDPIRLDRYLRHTDLLLPQQFQFEMNDSGHFLVSYFRLDKSESAQPLEWSWTEIGRAHV